MTEPTPETVVEQVDTPSVYLVLFAMNIQAPTPGDAVAGMVDLVVERGLRDWTYRVDTAADDGSRELIGYFDGYGEPRVIDAEGERTVEESDSSAADVTIPPDGEPVNDDQEVLTEYAQNLVRAKPDRSQSMTDSVR